MDKCKFCGMKINAGTFCTGFCAKKQQRIDLGIDFEKSDRKLGIVELMDN